MQRGQAEERGMVGHLRGNEGQGGAASVENKWRGLGAEAHLQRCFQISRLFQKYGALCIFVLV